MTEPEDQVKPVGREAGWCHYPHGADVGVLGRGASMSQAFEQAAMALTAIVTSAEIRPATRVAVHCEAPDRELLLVEWLNAVIYEMSTRQMLFGRFSVRVEDGRLEAEMWGEPVDRARHEPASEAKGATFTTLEVARVDGGGWRAQCVIDV